MLPQRSINAIMEDIVPLNQQQREAKAELEEWLKQVRQTLEWYAEKASAMQRYMGTKNNLDAMLAVCTELALDGGRRAEAVRRLG